MFLIVGIFPALAADVYVVPFSHLDLFWAGTRKECLSRGNRIITKAVRMASGTVSRAESFPNAAVIKPGIYDTGGMRGETAVELLGQKRRFREVNLIEEDTGAAEQEILRAAPFEIKTVRVAIPFSPPRRRGY